MYYLVEVGGIYWEASELVVPEVETRKYGKHKDLSASQKRQIVMARPVFLKLFSVTASFKVLASLEALHSKMYKTK